MSTVFERTWARTGDVSLLILKKGYFVDYLYSIDNVTGMSKDYFVWGDQH